MAWQAARRSNGQQIAWKNQTGGAVNIGAVVAIGMIFGILTTGAAALDTTLANAATGQATINGMFELPKLSTDTFVEGARLYWDSANSRVSTTAKGNSYIGIAGEIGTNGQTRVDVILNARSTHSKTLVIPIAAASVDGWAFVADRAYRVESIKEVHAVAGNDGGAVTLAVRKITADATAPDAAAGATVKELLAAALDLKSTANTLVDATLTATDADRNIAAGDRIGLNFVGVLTSLAGGTFDHRTGGTLVRAAGRTVWGQPSPRVAVRSAARQE